AHTTRVGVHTLTSEPHRDHHDRGPAQKTPHTSPPTEPRRTRSASTDCRRSPEGGGRSWSARRRQAWAGAQASEERGANGWPLAEGEKKRGFAGQPLGVLGE